MRLTANGVLTYSDSYRSILNLLIESVNLASSNEFADALLAGRIDATSIAALSVWMAIEQRALGTLKSILLMYKGYWC